MTTFDSRTLSVSIDCPSDRVYGFVSDPGNLPQWATGLCRSIRRSDADWIVETPQGAMKIRFAERNDYRVLDHFVTPAPGVEIYVPMRVLPNGSGSEVLFTLFRLPEMSEEEFVRDAGMVERDLSILKSVLEKGK